VTVASIDTAARRMDRVLGARQRAESQGCNNVAILQQRGLLE